MSTINALIDVDDETDDEQVDQGAGVVGRCATPTPTQGQQLMVVDIGGASPVTQSSGDAGDGDLVALCPPSSLSGALDGEGSSTVAKSAADLAQCLRIEPFDDDSKYSPPSSPNFDALAGAVAANRDHDGMVEETTTLCVGNGNTTRISHIGNNNNNNNETILKSAFEPLLLSPALSPQTVQPPQRSAGWSLESVPPADEDELGSNWNMIMDTSEVDDFFRSTDGEDGVPAELEALSVAGLDIEADIGAGGAQQGAARLSSKKQCLPPSGLTAEDVVIELLRKVRIEGLSCLV